MKKKDTLRIYGDFSRPERFTIEPAGSTGMTYNIYLDGEFTGHAFTPDIAQIIYNLSHDEMVEQFLDLEDTKVRVSQEVGKALADPPFQDVQDCIADRLADCGEGHVNCFADSLACLSPFFDRVRFVKRATLDGHLCQTPELIQ